MVNRLWAGEKFGGPDMSFDFYNPVKLITGTDCVKKNAAEFKKLGKSCLLVTSGTAAKKSGALDDVTAALEACGIAYEIYNGIGQNPTMESCMEAGSVARENKLEFVVGIGGGSPLDAAKAAAVYAANDMQDGMDIYKNTWENPALPIAAVGTTSGTGSEVTCFSIITMFNGRKKSFGNDETYPKVMFGDAKYTATLPLDFTKSTALDALAHTLEGYFNSTANAISDMYAVEAARILCPQLRLLTSAKAASDITMEQREQLYLASIIAGFSLSHCGTLYCHNLSYYFTEEYNVPHGFACAATLADLVMRGDQYAPQKAAHLFEAAKTSADELCDLIGALTVLPEINITPEEIERLSREGATTKNFAKTLPNGFTAADAGGLLTRLFGSKT